MPFEVILLDLDDTLYDYQSAHRPALDAAVSFVAEKLGKSVAETESAYLKARQSTNGRLKGLAASHSRLLYFQGVCESFNVKPPAIAPRAEEIYWRCFMKNMHLREHCLDFLSELGSRRVCIVSDLTSAVQLRKITRLGIEKYVDQIVTSEESGCEKPAAPIFELAFEKLLLKPDSDSTSMLERWRSVSPSACMIGDNYERDICGALQFGMRCFWLDPKSKAGEGGAHEKNDLVTQISDFRKLKEIFYADR